MKTSLLPLAALVGSVITASAQLTIPSDGSDGAFNPTSNVEIDLGLAATGIWNSAGSGNGVYDPEQWAVVYKFSSVNIPTGVRVTFKNHPTHAPVVWLVQGNITISGELNLDGKSGTADAVLRLIPTEAGPGGFRGGATGPSGNGTGYGPGGSDVGHAILGTVGKYSGTYGNPQILPLIGGSGSGSFPQSGGGGGGAISLFVGGSAQIDGVISAKGGLSSPSDRTAGSGGAVRLVASSVAGSGVIQCQNNGFAVSNGLDNSGRVRVETSSLSPSLRTFPETIGVPPANPPIIWPAANAPKARVISVDAVSAPTDPQSPLIAAADVAIQNNSAVNILIETRDFPIEGVVRLSVTPKYASRTWHTATRVSGDINQATWRVTTTLPQGFVTLQARATQP